jgi:methyl-accepting chemotaxis protein
MTFKNKIIIGFGAALAILILVSVVSFTSLFQNGRDRALVTHTYLVLGKLDAVLANLIDAETGQRGYIITGEVSYLEPYNNSRAHVNQNLADLRSMTADNPAEQRALDRLEPAAAAMLSTLQVRIEIRDNASSAH